MNEAESLRFIRSHTDVPVPTVYCDFQDDEAYYLITEYVEGVGMSELAEDQKATVRERAPGSSCEAQGSQVQQNRRAIGSRDSPLSSSAAYGR